MREIAQMEDIRTLIDDIEREAAASGVAIKHVCKAADVAPSNWARWKKGHTSPTFATWAKIEAASAVLIGEAIRSGTADSPTQGADFPRLPLAPAQ